MKLYCPNCGTKNPENAVNCIFCDTILTRISLGGALTEGITLQSRYQVIKQISQGKLSSIYFIRDITNNRSLALKEMHCDRYSKSKKGYILNRFTEEAKLLKNLNHSNLPKVINTFTFYGRYYIVMEYIEGYDLQFLLNKSSNKSIPEKLVVTWGVQLCEVLDYLHTRKPPVIYRDMKPSNIMIREKDGRLFLVDFGLAKVMETNKELTGFAVGTEGYIPPEQYAGKPTTASDIYALGATLHHLATGEFPFVPFIFKPVRKLNPCLSEELEIIIEKCLNLKADERYTSPLTLKRDLLILKASLTSKKSKKKALIKAEKPKFTTILNIEPQKYNVPPEVAERIAALESDIAQKILRSIEALSESKILPYLIQMMYNKDAEVRRAVATALGALKDSNGVSYLIELLRDNDPQVQQLAIWGLGEIKDKRALYPLLEILMTGDEDLRGCAALALAELNLEEALEPLMETFLHDKDPMVRKRAAKSLGKMSNKKSLNTLKNQLARETLYPIKQTVLWAIKRIEEENRLQGV